MMLEEEKEGKSILHGRKGKKAIFPKYRKGSATRRARRTSSPVATGMAINACIFGTYVPHAVATYWTI